MPTSPPMSPRAAFSGLRLKFMEDQLEAYAMAVVESRENDFVLEVQRRYFKRFPVSLPHDAEPTKESLDTVDDNEPDPEIKEPNQRELSGEEYKAAKEIFDQNCTLLVFRKEQIRRWLKYHHGKRHPSSGNAAGGSLSVFVAQLVGCDVKKPHKQTPYNLWAKEDANKSKIQKELNNMVQRQELPRTQHVKARADITRHLFQALPIEQQRRWTARVEEEYKKAYEEYDERLKSDPSTTPEDRQQCINNLPRLLQPILDLIHDYTGMQVTALIGGPEPADKGHINVIGLHAGGIPGPVRMNFGQAFRKDYREVIIPLFGQYLKRCYTREECRSRAVNMTDRKLHDLDDINQGGMNFDSVEGSPSSPGSTAVPRSPSVLATQSYSSVQHHPDGLVHPFQPRLSSPPTPTPPHGLALPPSPLQSPIATVSSFNHQNVGLVEKPPSRPVYPPHPEPQRMAVSTRLSSSLTCTGKRRSEECPPKGRGEVGEMKRQKTSQTRLADPAVQGACKLFLSVDFGKGWIDAVHHFQNFETLHPSNFKGTLKGVDRPICVHEWIKRGRSATYRPDPKISSKISKDFHSWWRSLQPEWRLSNGNAGLEKEEGDGDWSRLRISGANGILSIMAALFFWGSSLKSPDGDVGWNKALEDVISALKCMIKTAIVKTNPYQGKVVNP